MSSAYTHNIYSVSESPARETLYWWFVQRCAESPFLLSVLFSGEAGFGKDCIINFHSHGQWIEDSPHGLLQSRHEQQFSLNIWAGIAGN
jgi:hypothetical protein